MITMLRVKLLRICIVGLVGVLPAFAHGQSIVITAAQREKLTNLVRSDAEAAKLFDSIKSDADTALTAKPNPASAIISEGTLPQDPRRIKTWECLDDMPKLNALGYAYAVLGDAKYADKARQFILAWARVDHSAGDPIDDTDLEPLLVTYDLTRSTFPQADQTVVDTFLREVVEMEHKTARQTNDNHNTNWNSHRLKIVGLIAFILQDKSLIDQVVTKYKQQVDANINADGSTYDFHERDALHYHIYDLTPLLSLAIAARNSGVDLYSYQSPAGGSLAKGVAFLIPFANGTQQHGEFAHSKIAFDRERAQAGNAEYKAGSPFKPKSALAVLELDELFDQTVLPLAIHLSGTGAQRFPTWNILLNAARR